MTTETMPLRGLAGTESQPHAAAVLGPALSPDGSPSHAYLFYGPPGSGKRTAARAFAARLLADGVDAAQAERVIGRALREAHPDLTWVRRTGAAEMLVGDIEEPVVAAASRTPFEATRRVFVIEGADAMNDQAANRLLKTLEEPPRFAHLILLANRPQDVLPTIRSRCQLVRFDPLPPATIERLLQESGPGEQGVADASARLALGDADLARMLYSEQGTALRTAAEALVAASLGTDRAWHAGFDPAPWSALLQAARSSGAAAAEQLAVSVEEGLELLPEKERRKRQREGADAGRRLERRERTRTLDRGLRLLELWLRDMLCLAEGAGEVVHATDRLSELEAGLSSLRRGGGSARGLREAIGLVCETRLALLQNVSEELALEALTYRLAVAIHPGSVATA